MMVGFPFLLLENPHFRDVHVVQRQQSPYPMELLEPGVEQNVLRYKKRREKKNVATKKRSQHLELKLHYMSCLGVSQ